MTRERDIQECVRVACKIRHFAYYHTHNSRHSPAGWPDCVIADKRGAASRFIFAELKNETAKPSADQMMWLSLLAQLADEVGWDRVVVCLWRPAHWFDGSIDLVLDGAEPTEAEGRWMQR